MGCAKCLDFAPIYRFVGNTFGLVDSVFATQNETRPGSGLGSVCGYLGGCYRIDYLLLGFGTVLGGEIVVGIRKFKFLPVG